jgi:hypothetical protein
MLRPKLVRATLSRALYVVMGCFLAMSPPSPVRAADPSDELSDLCHTDSLPDDVRGSLSRLFSGWKVQEPSDLSARARTRWGEERPLSCPGIAMGHFQDPKNASYALLLIQASHSTAAYKVVIYTQQSGGKYYGFKAVSQADSGASDVFLHTVPPARFFDPSSKWVAHAKVTDAVMVVDSAATEAYLYLWSETNYDREQVNFQ